MCTDNIINNILNDYRMKQKTNNCPFVGLTPKEIGALKRVAAKEMSKGRVPILRNRAREIVQEIPKEARVIESCSRYIEPPVTRGFVDGILAAKKVHALVIELLDIMEELVTINKLQKGGLQ